MPIQINNAGLVLFNQYISVYFKGLGLIENNVFCCKEAQCNAVHSLQYLATGLVKTLEHQLVLNELLCELPVSNFTEPSIELMAENKQIGDVLIGAIFQHWLSIGSSSINGFRSNWLVQNGLLSRSDNRWNLVIERRPYDMLLQSFPFSFSIIEQPWMTTSLLNLGLKYWSILHRYPTT
jgi:hypothetical protein